jgi:hypothetical protein
MPGIEKMRTCLLALAIIVGIPAVSSAQENIAAVCEQLVIESIEARNAFDRERWVNSFSEDGEFVRLVTYKGHDALRELAGNWSKDLRYQVTSIVIEPIDKSTATGHTFVTLSWPSASDGGDSQSIVDGSALFLYLDEFDLTDDGCKIVRREDIAAHQRASEDPVNDG